MTRSSQKRGRARAGNERPARSEPTQTIRSFFTTLQQLGAKAGAPRAVGQADRSGHRK